MLHRNTSSRRRRASRNAANSPQGNPTSVSPASTRGRRASVAAERPTALATLSNNGNLSERSPRGSIVPDIALEDDKTAEASQETVCQRIAQDIDLGKSVRGGQLLQPEPNRSPRNSPIPDECSRNSRSSSICEANRSPRNSLTPEASRSPRNSFALDATIGRSPRHSLTPDVAPSPRNPFLSDPARLGYDRSPRNSLVPEVNRGKRNAASPVEATAQGTRNWFFFTENSAYAPSSRHPRASDAEPDHRGSVANLEYDPSTPELRTTPRSNAGPPVDASRNPRGSAVQESINRSPRSSITPEPNRFPRGSICPESNRSPRGSIVGPHESNRSPRGSIAVGQVDRNQIETDNRSPRGSIGTRDAERNNRGSLGGSQDRRSPRGSLTFLEPRRASADQGTSRTRSTSPCRQNERQINAAGNPRCIGNYGAQANLGYGTNAWADSRRASSSVSQFSGDESRRLCGGASSVTEKGVIDPDTLAVATYGSLAFQLKDAHLEAGSTCDFVSRALGVIGKTLGVTICLACLSAMPPVMLIMGLQFIRDCPREPHIPVYMVVGGTLGGVRMLWTLYVQICSRRPEILSGPETGTHMSPTRLASLALSGFLAVWFVLGNFWILNIKWPDYAPTLFEPNRWCDKSLYIFSLVHLCIVYAALAASILAAAALAVCRILSCPWPDRKIGERVLWVELGNGHGTFQRIEP
ncbi:serine/arginine repetitive matrix protein 1-like isoform X1 [Neodiprion fabricii]|uniref:serine/arginine repetitive matrix protein 1-like isoform X1 n=1 Tax=Neodiprion fabricii TaxID=2872261 RepID=UPI001ED931FE|nr:serine/arginine repetitive matrix protein 1-like isoform X1 [Neodiprion fabricii]